MQERSPASTLVTRSAIAIGGAGALVVAALTFFRGSLHGFHGLVAAAAFAGLAYSPLVVGQPGLRRAALGLAVVVLIVGQVMGGIAWLAEGVVVGAAMALALARMLPYDAGIRVRLAAGLGSTLTFLFIGIGVGAGVGVGTHDSSFLGQSLVLGIAALLAMETTLWVALRKIRADALARPVAAVQVPQGWFWGKLNHRALGRRALGYRYIDPTAGASFHVVGDLDHAPSADELRRAGYRGGETVRLGGHVTMYPRDGASADEAALLAQEFDAGGPVGVVVLALSVAERRALGLPDAPPWSSSYLG